jgi:hypothetical protein
MVCAAASSPMCKEHISRFGSEGQGKVIKLNFLVFITQAHGRLLPLSGDHPQKVVRRLDACHHGSVGSLGNKERKDVPLCSFPDAFHTPGSF